MHRLVVDGRWALVVDDVAPLLRRELQRFQITIQRDGVRQVVGPGALRRDCPPNRVVEAGKECFGYHLRGAQVVPVEGVRRIDARFRLWVAYDDGRWEVINYDYNVT